MPVITKADLSRLVGVSKAAITKAVASHHIALDAEGLVDTDIPSNAAWIAAKRAGIRQAHKASTPKPPKGDTVSPPPSEDDEDETDDPLEAMAEAAAEKLKLTRARRIDTEKASHLKEIQIAIRKGDLVQKDLTRRRWAAFDAALKTHLRDLPRRTAARLAAIAQAEGPAALERALEEEISAALGRVRDAAKDAGLS